MIPSGDFQTRPGDRITAVVTYKALRKAEAMLAADEDARLPGP